MEDILLYLGGQVQNYAVKSGIALTGGFLFDQASRFIKNAKGGSEKSQLAGLQMRLESKIRIISPAIDMIEMIAARGNTTLESAVTLTSALRWDIQALGVRLQKAAANEEMTRKGSFRALSAEQNNLELKLIIADTKQLLERIEDAVPLINLAITTSGVNLSTSLPQNVSPSRLLQASTLLTSGDAQYSMDPTQPKQICPDFTVSMYMLFSGHTHRPHGDDGIRETTWKEVMHKARMKILRVPLRNINDYPSESDVNSRRESFATDETTLRDIPSDGTAYEYAYQILLIEDLDDGRVHTYEDNEPQPGPYEGVDQAGIRELIPIHEVSKIFYADSGKILNIGTDGETNSPVLLLKRDVNAVPPRRMMQRNPASDDEEESPVESSPAPSFTTTPVDEQSELDEQLFRESPAPEGRDTHAEAAPKNNPWRLPSDLDPEWVAFEVFVDDSSDDSDVDDEPAEPSSASASPASHRQASRSQSLEPSLMSAFSKFSLRGSSPFSGSPAGTPLKNPMDNRIILSPQKAAVHTRPSGSLALPAMRTSLSLLEMLIRLTALQQFQQTSHLAIPDELLNFFLSESATVGSGGDAALRQRVRRDARQRVGFDPYDESPIKRRGEEYLAHNGDEQEGSEHWDSYASDARSSRQSSSHNPFQTSGPPNEFSRRFSSSQRSARPSPAHASSEFASTSSPDIPIPSREAPSPHNRASPSPLLRRATAPQADARRAPTGLSAAPRRPAAVDHSTD